MRGARAGDFDARLSCAIHLSCSPSVPTSSMPDKNVSLCTRGPILCLMSHLRLLFCSLHCPSLPLSYLSAPLLPASCSCNEGHRHSHCPRLPHPHAPAPGQITPATCTGRSPGTLPAEAFIHPSPCPSEPLIPSSWHPVTEEWPVWRVRTEWDTERLVVRMCVF